jgi:hypothetical protein
MRRWKKDGNHFLPNNKLVQEREGNEENGYPDSELQENKEKLYQVTQWSPKEESETNKETNEINHRSPA